jgi:hypothetical protein
MKLSLVSLLFAMAIAYAGSAKSTQSCADAVDACLEVQVVDSDSHSASCNKGKFSYCIQGKSGVPEQCKNHGSNQDSFSHMNVYAAGVNLGGECSATDFNSCNLAPGGTGTKYENYDGASTCVEVNVNSDGTVPDVVFAVKDRSDCDGSGGGWTCTHGTGTCACNGNNPGSNSCVKIVSTPACTPPCVVGCGGDPHIMRFNGGYYDFFGECDLVLIHAPDFAHGLGLDIHIRTKILDSYSYIGKFLTAGWISSANNVTILQCPPRLCIAESAAVRVGDDIMEVSSWGVYAMNGVIGAPPSQAQLGPLTVKHDSVIKQKKNAFVIQVGDKETIKISAYKKWVNINISGPSKDNFGTSRGLMGEYGTGRLLGRDGTTEFTIKEAVAFGNEWQVTAEEPKLFVVKDRIPQLASGQKCIMPADRSDQRRLGETLAEEAAEKACAEFGDKADLFEMCVYDVMASGDLDMVSAGVF